MDTCLARWATPSGNKADWMTLFKSKTGPPDKSLPILIGKRDISAIANELEQAMVDIIANPVQTIPDVGELLHVPAPPPRPAANPPPPPAPSSSPPAPPSSPPTPSPLPAAPSTSTSAPSSSPPASSPSPTASTSSEGSKRKREDCDAHGEDGGDARLKRARGVIAANATDLVHVSGTSSQLYVYDAAAATVPADTLDPFADDFDPLLAHSVSADTDTAVEDDFDYDDYLIFPSSPAR